MLSSENGAWILMPCNAGADKSYFQNESPESCAMLHFVHSSLCCPQRALTFQQELSMSNTRGYGCSAEIEL